MTPASPKPPSESAIPDVLGPDLQVVFCGINPGRVSAAAGAHFANPRNDFWRLLHDAGFTRRLLTPGQQFEALDYGIGITNAAFRTTPGSGDLRRADFAGSSKRLERLARELRPAWIGFVGKEAYRGAFSERTELGLQERRLADTQLFVLPSTSPANAAVPYAERLRWFEELAARCSGKPLRDAVRVVVLDPDDRMLLVRFDFGRDVVWATPGGGLEPGETDAQAIARELAEEAGIREYELGPCIWTRDHWFLFPSDHVSRRFGGQRERIYVAHAPAREPSPELSWDVLRTEAMTDIRWWTIGEIAAAEARFAPRRLPTLIRELVERGPPAEPLDVGV